MIDYDELCGIQNEVNDASAFGKSLNIWESVVSFYR